MKIPQILLFLLTLPSGFLFSQESGLNRLSVQEAIAVDRAVQGEIKKQDLVGVSIGIIQDNKIVYLKGYGFSDLKNRRPVTTQTIFNWASNSKPLAAIAAMQLVDQGLLYLDQNVYEYVSEYPDRRMTSRQLLSHQSGIPHYPSDPTPRRSTDQSPIESIAVFKNLSPLFRPGEKFFYSSYGYILLSAVIERAGHESFFNQVQKRIAEPLGMKSLQLDTESADQSQWSLGYEKINGTISETPLEFNDWKYGAGGFKSNIQDFALFAEALMNHKLVSSNAEREMWTPQITSRGEKTRFGLGFQLSAQGGEKIFHSGHQREATTRLVIYPPGKQGVVVLCNCGYGEPADISTAIFSALSHAHRNEERAEE